jgi:radical SAM superfamily enzyme YgiQ (UPF0313 family)
VTASAPTKERVLLLNPPGARRYARDKYCTSISFADYYWPQIDLLVLSGRLKEKYAVTLLDAIVARQRPAKLLSQLAAEKYKACIFLTSLASLPEDFAFIEALKRLWPETEMIGNGGILLARGEEIMARNWFLDAALLDFTTEHILDYLDGQRPAPDMITRKDGHIIRGPRRQGATFAYPTPLHELVGRGRYHLPIAPAPKFTVSITSTGCPNGCVFCVPRQVGFRRRDQDNALEELAAVERAGFSHVVFHDATFVNDRDYVSRLCDRMLQNRLRLKWACQTRIDSVDEEILGLMRSAGCRVIEYGVESGDNRTLAAMNKGITVEQIRETLAATNRQGLRSVAFFIVGMPGETETTMRKTVDLAVAINCDYASFSVPRPQPGTKLGESAGPIPAAADELAQRMRALAYRKFYLRPAYWWKRLKGTESFYELRLQFRIFASLLGGLLKPKSP